MSDPSTQAAPSAEPTVSSPEPTTAPVSAPESAAPATQPVETTERPDVHSYFDSLPPEEQERLFRHPKVSGRVGDLAQRQAKQLLPTLKEQDEVQALMSEKSAALASRDLVRVGEIEAELSDRQTRKAAASEPTYKFASEVQNDLAREATEIFGPDVVNAVAAEMAGKPFDGTFGEGTAKWVGKLAAAATKANEGKLFAKWEKERLPTLRKQLLAEINGGEETPDVGGSGASPRRSWTAAEVAALSPDEYVKHEADIMAAMPRTPVSRARSG